MEETITRAKLAAVGAGSAMLFASGIVAYGIVEHSIEATVGGGFAALAAAAMLTLAKVRAWTVDTRAERQQLEDTRTRYLANEVALHGEHNRRVRDLEAERVMCHRQLEAAKAALIEEFEAKREELIVECMEAGVQVYLKRIRTKEVATPEAKIMPFPAQGAAQPARERATAHPADAAPEAARDRGVARP